MAREVEVKFKLSSEQQVVLEEWIAKNAKKESTTHQVEYYLDNPSASFLYKHKLGYIDSEHFLRVRFDEQKGDSVCLKIFEIDQEMNASTNIDEIEYSVSSGKETLKLFTSLGYTNQTEVDKTRHRYTTNDGVFEICLDEVKNLGKFIEVELREQFEGEVKIGYQKIWKFLSSIGITEIDEQKRGYTSMLWNPEVNFGKVRKLVDY